MRNHKAAGRKAKKRGDEWEGRIIEANSQYRRIGLAIVEHYGPAVRWVNQFNPSTKRWAAAPKVVGKAPPDFLGFLKGGAGVAFEAKEIPNKIKWTNDERIHQYHALMEWRRVSGLKNFGYLICWQYGGLGEEIRWHHVEDIEYSILPEKLVFRAERGILVPWMEVFTGIPDWLRVLGRSGG